MRFGFVGWSSLAVLCLGGCGYPSFGFAPSDAPSDAADETSIADDARRDGEVGRDSAADTADAADATVDTAVDTAADTAADTAVDAADASDAALDTDSTDTNTADTLDSAVAPDSAVDVVEAGDAAEAGPPLAGSCVGPHTFCVDFDAPAITAPYGFYGLGHTPGSSCALDTTRAASSPRSMLCTVAASTLNPNNAFATQRLDGPGTATLTRADADVFLEVNSYPASNVTLLKIQRWGDGHGVGLSLRSTGAAVEARGTATTWYPLPSPLPTGRWFHVRLEARLQITGGSFALYVDDMTTPLVTGSAVSTVDVEGIERELFAGLWVDDVAATTLRVGYDDVSMDFAP